MSFKLFSLVVTGSYPKSRESSDNDRWCGGFQLVAGDLGEAVDIVERYCAYLDGSSVAVDKSEVVEDAVDVKHRRIAYVSGRIYFDPSDSDQSSQGEGLKKDLDDEVKFQRQVWWVSLITRWGVRFRTWRFNWSLRRFGE
ncbi:MAG: hypothetical protein AAF235_06240 [Planctomycetota bacterium]